ncbi:restriction endonuclease subunit S [Bacteroides xylanisolvens]|uniref:restriction endonuclease subunit S n=1 Tax=Bacteroides xylanisolvens TaxID=371601 RepID=UPI001CDD4AF8|nr:restriction endonuclease subunit S [Bacteroides xylanisolvens]MCA4567386.1 restriction endonuclease subunit S [Bacteroides xylanisolvens]
MDSAEREGLSPKGNVPTLRFPEFQGEWEKCKVSDLLDFYSTNSLSWDKLEYGTDAIQNLHYGLIHVGLPTMIDLNKDKLPNITNGNTPKNYELCQEGDIAFADASEDTNEVAKAVEFYKLNGKDVICGLHTIHGRDNQQKTVVGYKGYAFSSTAFHHQIRRIAQGTKIYSINSKNFSECYIGIPSKEEQKKIATLLRLIDERIATKNKIIDKLQSLIKGISSRIFASIQGIEYRLGDIATITNGDSNVQDAVTEPKEGMYPFFDRSEDVKYLPTFLFDKEAIIYPGEGTEFMPRYIKGKFALHQRCYAIFDFKDTVTAQFLYFYLKTQNFYFVRNAVGSTVPSLRLDTFQKLKVIIPPKIMQHKVSLCLSSMEQKCNAEKAILQLLLKQKQYLLRQMFI